MEGVEWTLSDDLNLVEALIHCGFGNWTDIANRLHNKTSSECSSHYLDKFIIDPDNEELKKLVKDWKQLRHNDTFCTHCNLRVEHDWNKCHSLVQFLDLNKHIRDVGENKTVSKNDANEAKCLNTSDKLVLYQRKTKSFMTNIGCINYNPFRSEFDIEYDNKAESILEMLWEPPESWMFPRSEDNFLYEQLKYTVADSYNLRLIERINRKKTIKNHGLIDKRKTYSMMQRFDVPFGSSYLTTLFSFIKLFNGTNLDFLVEKLNYENELRNKLNSLLMYRSLGIRFLNGIHIYEKLSKKRYKYKKEIGYNGAPLIMEALESRNSRKPSAPLTLYNLPGFNLLDEEEKHLCSTARIVPETYYNFKKLLISECKKHDGLKLAQARQLLKIDVNKTRKMYDYLISTGDIW